MDNWAARQKFSVFHYQFCITVSPQFEHLPGSFTSKPPLCILKYSTFVPQCGHFVWYVFTISISVTFLLLFIRFDEYLVSCHHISVVVLETDATTRMISVDDHLAG